ncbi:uncharacterized protein LOC109611737 [Musca domestica]|uniref:Uncharacterized protein LOC109611737 n=1 Tax=Musca domestica TaxID=7370 RepID=A0A9J7IEZ7_MUSDO|nr:uncharacterized protein LOC109611737 [Musca domestica]
MRLLWEGGEKLFRLLKSAAKFCNTIVTLTTIERTTINNNKKERAKDDKEEAEAAAGQLVYEQSTKKTQASNQKKKKLIQKKLRTRLHICPLHSMAKIKFCARETFAQ